MQESRSADQADGLGVHSLCHLADSREYDRADSNYANCTGWQTPLTDILKPDKKLSRSYKMSPVLENRDTFALTDAQAASVAHQMG